VIGMPSIDIGKFAIAVVLSIVFTVALFHATFEMPLILDNILRKYYPDVFWDYEARIHVIETIKPYAYLALIITFLLIILGFLARKGFLSSLGAVAFYLPVFGYFACAMFFLAGIGVLRALWLPLLDVYPWMLELGSIVLIPFVILMQVNGPHQFWLSMMAAEIFIVLGIIIFSMGVLTWLYGKFKGYTLIDFWIYRYSRHPQYLGFILWSYGMLISTCFKPYVMGGYMPPPTFPWLLSTFIIIGVALSEEIEMTNKLGETYTRYRERTPFLIPLPKKLAKALTLPLKVKGKDHPETRWDILFILGIYMILLIGLSIIFVCCISII